MKIDDWEKGLKHYEGAIIQANNDIEFTSIVIDALKKHIEKIKQNEEKQDGE